MVSAIIAVLGAHWVADFVLQSHWMASNKSKNWWALSSHVITYTGTILVLMGAIMLAIMPSVSLATIFIWAIANGIIHFAVDAFTSRWTSTLWAKNDYHNFFVVIGFDQLIHAITLISTLAFVIA